LTPSHQEDPLFDAIAGLPVVRPDAEHVERVRGRCHATLTRPAVGRSMALEPATVGAICVIYAWHIVKIATRIPLP